MNVSIPISLPLDAEGFLRRECPRCQEQFKWLPTQTEDTTPRLTGCTCPLCGHGADASAFWTPEQAEHINATLKSKVLGPQIEQFQRNLRGLNRSGGSVRITTTPVRFEEPSDLSPEPSDMRRVESACHPSEPLKVPENWTHSVYCLVCGSIIEEEKA
jgi:hypothetical protein